MPDDADAYSYYTDSETEREVGASAEQAGYHATACGVSSAAASALEYTAVGVDHSPALSKPLYSLSHQAEDVHSLSQLAPNPLRGAGVEHEEAASTVVSAGHMCARTARSRPTIRSAQRARG